jgi:Do/DeqQ family serine protease
MRSSIAIAVLMLVPAAALPSTLSERRSPVVEVVEQVGPAVVNIATTQVIEQEATPFSLFRDPMFDRFFHDFSEPQRRRYTRTSLGSGVIIRQDGYILTNLHVVVRGARVTVVVADEREFEARLVGSDADSDLAVLKVEAKDPLPAANMGSSSDLMIGESVIAIGNPFGLSHTVTTGVVSATGRSLRGERQTYYDLIQTDASINPGNSGGPLLNIAGELIGINTAIYQGAEGIGFAIPIDRAKRIVADLISYGEVQPAWIGILAQDIARAVTKGGGAGRSQGVLVRGVEAGSPADEAGVAPGDLIVTIDGHRVGTTDEWETRLRDHTPGSVVDIELLREGQTVQVQLKTRNFPVERADNLAWQNLGIRVRARGGHLEVEAVRRSSPAAEIGLRAGDEIVGVGGEAVDSLDRFRRKLIAHRNAQRVLVSVQRGERVYQVTMPLGGVL